MAFAGAFSTFDATETALNHGTIFRIRDVEEQVVWRNKNSSEFYKFLTNIRTGPPATQPRKEWGEQDKAPNFVIVKAAAVSGATAIDVFDAWQAVTGDTFYNDRTGEIMRTDNIDDADTISFAATTGFGRGFMNTTAAAVRVGDRLLKIGNLMAEEDTAADSRGVVPVERWNYLEAFQKTWTVTSMQENSEMLDGVGKIDQAWMRSIWELDEEVNAALFFSRRNRLATAKGTLYTMNGFDAQVRTHAIDFAGVVVPTWGLLNERFSPLFQDTESSSEKVFFCGQGAYSSFVNAARAAGIKPDRFETLWGTEIDVINVDGGTLHLVKDYKTFKGNLSASGRVVDMGHVFLNPYRGWDRIVKPNIQLESQPTIRKDMAFQALTLRVELERLHARVDGLSGAFNTNR